MLFPVVLACVFAAPPDLTTSGSCAIQSQQEEVLDSASIHQNARSLQARFERSRYRLLPRSSSSSGSKCEEIIGRFCIWDDDDDWTPRAEPPEIAAARAELLTGLDSLAQMIPGDRWIFSQQIRYLAEARRFTEGTELATACQLAERWLCSASLGTLAHLQGKTTAAEAAFTQALANMNDDQRAEWTKISLLLDAPLRSWLESQPDSSMAVTRLWTLADPLFITPGNERWTEHLARWTYAELADRTITPHRMRWGSDNTEMTVRYGWPVAWERSWPRPGETAGSVIGRDPPGDFRALPPANFLAPPTTAKADWDSSSGFAQSKFLPPCLDSLAPLRGQIGRFWRTDGVTIVAVTTVPSIDPTSTLDSPPNKLCGATKSANRSVHAGLFLEERGRITAAHQIVVAQPDSPTQSDATSQPKSIRLTVVVPNVKGIPKPDAQEKSGVASLELLMPSGIAFRKRTKLSLTPLTPGKLDLSDIMLVEPGAQATHPVPTTFTEMASTLRSSFTVPPGEQIGVALEIYGLSGRLETVRFRLWVEPAQEGLLARAARWLRLKDSQELLLSWDESGPPSPGPLFRAFNVALPGLELGDYNIVIEVTTAGQPPVVRQKRFSVG